MRLKINNPFLKNVSFLASGSVLAQAITILVSPIIMRIYDPTSFGIFSVFLSSVTIFAALSTGQYENAIMLQSGKDRILSASIITVLLSAGISTFFGISVWLINPLLMEKIQFLKVPGSGAILGLAVFLTSMITVMNLLNNKMLAYQRIAAGKTIQATTVSSTSIVYGMLSASFIGLQVGLLAGRLINVLFLVKPHFVALAESLGTLKYDQFRAHIKRYRKFPLFTSWAIVFNTISAQIPIFTFEYFYTSSEVGLYALAQRIIIGPVLLLSGSVGQVFFQEGAAVKDDPVRLMSISSDISDTISKYSAIPFAIIVLFGEIIFKTLFGDAWSSAGIFAQYLAIPTYFVMSTNPLLSIFSILEKQKSILAFNAILLIARAIVVIAMSLLGFPVLQIITVYAFVSGLLWLSLNLYIFRLLGSSVLQRLIVNVKWISASLIILKLIETILSVVIS